MSSATDEPGRSGMARGQVTVGRSVLQLGRPAGTALTAGADGRSNDLPKLVDALDEDDGKAPEAADHGVAADANAIVERASDVTAQVERANTLFNEVADGRLSVADVKDEVDVLLGLLGRLDREGRWSEVLALARALSGLLGLIRRWLQLVRSLRTALSAAEKLGDLDAIGWAEHELGSLHLAGGNAAAAERRLGQAREIRQRLGDRDGLAVTEHNLQAVCRLLRQLLREGRLVQTSPRLERLRHSRVVVVAIAAALLATGAVAGAVLRGSGHKSAGNSGNNGTGQVAPDGQGIDNGQTDGGAADGSSSNTQTGKVDADGDGYIAAKECNDQDASIHPGAKDIPRDGIDQNCDGVDGTVETTVDADGDGYTAPDDCNDSDDSIHPGAADTPGDGIDQNCDGVDG